MTHFDGPVSAPLAHMWEAALRSEEQDSFVGVCQKYARNGAWGNYDFTNDSHRDEWDATMLRRGLEEFQPQELNAAVFAFSK